MAYMVEGSFFIEEREARAFSNLIGWHNEMQGGWGQKPPVEKAPENITISKSTMTYEEIFAEVKRCWGPSTSNEAVEKVLKR